MSKNIISTVSHLLSNNSNGGIDWEVSLLSIRMQMEVEMCEKREWDVKIENSLDAIYDSMDPGVGLPTPVVVQTASANLAEGNLQEQIRIASLVEDFLQRTNRFVSKRGRSGGLFRIG